MSWVQTVRIAVASDADGNGAAYSDVVEGFVELVKVTLGTLVSGQADLTITDEETGAPIVTLTNVTDGLEVRPRGPTHDLAGAAALFAAGGAAVNEKVCVNGRIKVVVAQGGASKAGSVAIMLS
jgi:hypothetical protein